MEDFSTVIINLYDRILRKEKTKFSVQNQSICQQIEKMKTAYLPNRNWEQEVAFKVVDYNDPAARCAYVHKHAMCYTGMVNYLLTAAILNCSLLQCLEEDGNLKICSLGGGPGTDIVGILNVFTKFFNCMFYNVCIIDYKEDWQKIFSSVIKELQNGSYGDLSSAVLPDYFDYQYMQANLLRTPFNENVKQAIMQANFLSMIKFISAAACTETRQMVNEIFNSMKLGAVALFIDNAAGGFLQMLQREANQCGMISIYGPLAHYEYNNAAFSLERFGYLSQSKTKVSMQLWKKHFSQQLFRQHVLLAELTKQRYTDNKPPSSELGTNNCPSNRRKTRKRQRKVKSQPKSINPFHSSADQLRNSIEDNHSSNVAIQVTSSSNTDASSPNEFVQGASSPNMLIQSTSSSSTFVQCANSFNTFVQDTSSSIASFQDASLSNTSSPTTILAHPLRDTSFHYDNSYPIQDTSSPPTIIQDASSSSAFVQSSCNILVQDVSPSNILNDHNSSSTLNQDDISPNRINQDVSSSNTFIQDTTSSITTCIKVTIASNTSTQETSSSNSCFQDVNSSNGVTHDPLHASYQNTIHHYDEPDSENLCNCCTIL